MNTTENNKMIAKFMGWGKDGDDWIIPPHLYTPFDIYELETGLYYFRLDSTSLEFHKNWNWLMEVVQKIESLHEANNVLIGTNLTYVQIHNKVSNEQETFKGFSSIKIEATYNACIEFIKWYNQQKQ